MKEDENNSQPGAGADSSRHEPDKDLPDEAVGKSGQQKGREHVAAVRNYVNGLKERGEPIPVRSGKPNWTAIASACGFLRGVFYDNDDAREVIELAFSVEDSGDASESSAPGTQGDRKTPTETGRAAHTRRKLEGSERRVQQLEEQLAAKTAECEGLRGQVKELEEKLRRYSTFEEVMASSGRRYVP